jgi:hypothetical protein
MSSEVTDAAPGVAGRRPALILLVTGIGMRGALENALGGRAARFFDPPVPVLVHHYGVARSGTIFRWCQRAAAHRLAERFRALSDSSDRPDIIAHSFGAWLVGHVLRQHRDIRVGRIIMAGSVLRPDFDWASLICGGQVEAVLNHYGSQDLWSYVSDLFIPESGPAGFVGFAECPGVFNRVEPGFRHTTFFLEGHIDQVHRSLWQPFLHLPAAMLRELTGPDTSRTWRPRSWLLRANLVRTLLLTCLAAFTLGLFLEAARLAGAA